MKVVYMGVRETCYRAAPISEISGGGSGFVGIPISFLK
jgi:hypothetical protein